MKKVFTYIVLILSLSTFAQDTSKYNYTVGFSSDVFLNRKIYQEHFVGGVMYIERKVSVYFTPMFTADFAINRNIFKRIDIGASIGLAAILDNRYFHDFRRQKHVFSVPMKINLQYKLGNQKKLFTPFIRGHGGYTYLKTDSSTIEVETSQEGGINYGLSFGVGFNSHKRKLKKWNAFKLLISYNNYVVHKMLIDRFDMSQINTLYYTKRGETVAFRVEYVFPQKKKEK